MVDRYYLKSSLNNAIRCKPVGGSDDPGKQGALRATVSTGGSIRFSALKALDGREFEVLVSTEASLIDKKD